MFWTSIDRMDHEFGDVISEIFWLHTDSEMRRLRECSHESDVDSASIAVECGIQNDCKLIAHCTHSLVQIQMSFFFLESQFSAKHNRSWNPCTLIDDDCCLVMEYLDGDEQTECESHDC